MVGSFHSTPGSVFSSRNRPWVVLPSEIDDVIRLRPLSGNEDQVCGIYQLLELEPLQSTHFPIPQAESIQDHTAAQLLMDAARLSLRSGALGVATLPSTPVTLPTVIEVLTKFIRDLL